MRIVGGSHKGKTLVAPQGLAVRPTSDRARQAVFNILMHRFDGAALAGARVVDAFAGTGAMGLEALSRGAAHVTFIDDAREALAAIRANATAMGALDRVAIIAGDARKPPKSRVPCALAFLDPPYGLALAVPALAALAAMGWLAPGALCAVETAATEALDPPAGFSVLERRVYAKAAVTFLTAPTPPG